MNLIVAVDRNWGIGKGNDLLFHIPEDMKFFRSMTVGKTVVCGRKTLESFPGGKPLPGRKHFVLSRTPQKSEEDLSFVGNVEELFLELSKINGDEVFVIGGAQVYRLLYKHCKLAYVTKILHEDPKADCFFPNLDEDEAFVLEDSGEIAESKNGLRFAFCVYRNLLFDEKSE